MDRRFSSSLPHAVMRKCGTCPGKTALLTHALILYTVQIHIIDERFTMGPRKRHSYRFSGLYVKFTLLAERVFLISFHRLEHPIRTTRGHEVIP